MMRHIIITDDNRVDKAQYVIIYNDTDHHRQWRNTFSFLLKPGRSLCVRSSACLRIVLMQSSAGCVGMKTTESPFAQNVVASINGNWRHHANLVARVAASSSRSRRIPCSKVTRCRSGKCLRLLPYLQMAISASRHYALHAKSTFRTKQPG